MFALSECAVFLCGVFLTVVSGAPANTMNQNEDSIDLSGLGPVKYSVPSEKSGIQLQRWYEGNGTGTAEEQGEYFQGDILFRQSLLRNGVAEDTKKWHNGEVPVEIDPRIQGNELAQIKKAMQQYHIHTCVKFVKKNDDDEDYLFVTNGPTGCWSHLGRVGGLQKLNLQSPGCTKHIGTPMHELMHTLGVFHEHTRPDRNTYIDVHWDNIEQKSWPNFQNNLTAKTSTYGTKYDYGSLMHYSSTSFSTNGKKTITAKQSGGESKMGQREKFSEKDLMQINNMYNCKNKPKMNDSLGWL